MVNIYLSKFDTHLNAVNIPVDRFSFFCKHDQISKTKKRARKGVWSCTILLLLSSDYLASSEIFIKSSIQRILSPQMISTSCGMSRIYNSLTIAKRGCSHFNDNQTPIQFRQALSSKAIKKEESQLKKYEFLFNQCENLFKELKSSMDSNKQQNVQSIERGGHIIKKHAVIMPIPTHNFETSSVQLVDNRSSLSSDPTETFRVKKTKANDSTITASTNQKDTPKINQPVSKSIKKMRDDLIHKIMSAARTKNEINKQELRSIVDLYSALPRRPKDGITKVLTCITDTPKSSIYNDVVAHIESKSSDLDTYRKTFKKLNGDFSEDVTHVLYRAIEELQTEKDQVRRKISADMDNQDRFAVLAEGSHPLYPVDQNEVKAIFELYSSLTHRPKDGVTKVLNYVTNTPKSSIYHDVISHALQKGSDLETYRDIYARFDKALNGEGMKTIYRMMDGSLNAHTNKKRMSFPKQVITSQSESNVSVRRNAQNRLEDIDANEQRSVFSMDTLEQQSESDVPALPTVHNLSEEYDDESASARQNNDEDSNDNAVDSQLDNQTFENGPTDSCMDCQVVEVSDNTVQAENIQYSMSMKERERLNQIYGLLPEYSGRSVTGVLSGSTTDKNLPIWNAVQDAIDQIKRESQKEGDKTTIDLDYFKKLLIASQSIGRLSTKGQSRHVSDDVLQTADGKYSISKKERERLNQVYSLLPHCSGRSITGVLSGSTTDDKLPIWKDVQSAIAKIRQNAVRKGERTTIDLNYFRKLHWSSVRIIGRGGSKDLNENNKEKPSVVLDKVKKKIENKNTKKIKVSKLSKKSSSSVKKSKKK